MRSLIVCEPQTLEVNTIKQNDLNSPAPKRICTSTPITSCRMSLEEVRKMIVKRNLALDKLKLEAGPNWQKSSSAISSYKFFAYTSVQIKWGHRQQNVMCLLGMGDNILYDNKHLLLQYSRFVPQRTDKWFELQKEVKVTGSTIHKADGLSITPNNDILTKW